MRICDIDYLYFTGKVTAKYRQTENLKVKTLSLVLNLNVAGLFDQIEPEFRILRGGCIISAPDPLFVVCVALPLSDTKSIVTRDRELGLRRGLF